MRWAACCLAGALRRVCRRARTTPRTRSSCHPRRARAQCFRRRGGGPRDRDDGRACRARRCRGRAGPGARVRRGVALGRPPSLGRARRRFSRDVKTTAGAARMREIGAFPALLYCGVQGRRVNCGDVERERRERYETKQRGSNRNGGREGEGVNQETHTHANRVISCLTFAWARRGVQSGRGRAAACRRVIARRGGGSAARAAAGATRAASCCARAQRGAAAARAASSAR